LHPAWAKAAEEEATPHTNTHHQLGGSRFKISAAVPKKFKQQDRMQLQDMHQGWSR
jgi:hypothetical protein